MQDKLTLHANLANMESDVYDLFGDDGIDYLHKVVDKIFDAEDEGYKGSFLLEDAKPESLVHLQVIGYLATCGNLNFDSGHAIITHQRPRGR